MWHITLVFFALVAGTGDSSSSSEGNLNTSIEIDSSKAENLYERVFTQYGDDSVAQLGSAHLACEQS